MTKEEAAKKRAIEVFPENRTTASTGGNVYSYDMNQQLRVGFEEGFKAGAEWEAEVLIEWAKNMKRICHGAEPFEKAYQTIIDKLNSI